VAIRLAQMTARRRLLHAESDKDFRQAFADLFDALDMGWREFATEMSQYEPTGRGWTAGYLNLLKNGRRKVSGEPMYVLQRAAAKVAGIKPTYFREYREHLAAQRAAQLATEIGLDEVLAVLDELAKKRRS
jgi:hypothetical protein